MSSCQICGGQHPNPSTSCEQCWGCLILCERKPGCTFVNEKNPLNNAVEQIQQQPTQVIEKIALNRIKIEDSIRCWIISSLAKKYDVPNFKVEDVVQLANEFQEILDENLSLVDSKYQHFIIRKEMGKKLVEELDNEYLFINQDQDYILYKDYKRINLGKKIAKMEKEDDTV
jgi:hypothetical protein